MAERALPAPVERVDLFEDRATVTRRVTLDEPGRHTVVVGPITPLVRERGLAFLGEGALVEDVAVRRIRVAAHDADAPRASELREAAEAARHRLGRVRADLARAEEQAGRAKASRDAARAWTPRALVEAAELGPWLDALRTLEEAAVDGAVQVAEARARHAELDDELQQLERRLEAARAGKSALRAELVLQVLVTRPGALRIRYTVPCAVWRPAHRAELVTGSSGARVSWEIAATAWNATGEDWRGVTLVCSTARPGDHAGPPALEDDLVRARRRDREVVVELRDDTVAEARVGDRVTRGDVGVDDGGEPRTFTAPGPVDLPSDGRPVRIPLERWEDAAITTWLGHPERASEVVLRSTQHNTGARPLLAGPVDLVRDGLAAGRGEVGLVPPGEAFHLGWGSHDGLRVVRRRDVEVERRAITGRQTHRTTVELKLAHLGDAPVRFTLVERIPVSEVKEVTVGRPTAEPALAQGPDADGFCTWTLELAPGAVEKLVLTYVVEAPSHVRLPG